MSEEEYLRFEEAAVTKHEYRNGEIVDMAVGTYQHAQIASNLVRRLGNQIDGKACAPLGSDLRVRIYRTGSYYYPDVSIVCGSPIYDPPDTRSTISNPQVVIEVTSASTEGLDRGETFYDYMRIESLQEYVLVSQDRVRVSTFYRQADGIWAFGPSADSMDQSVAFRTLGIELPLSEIYAGVELQPVPPKPEPV